MSNRPLILITPSAQRQGVEFHDPSSNLSDLYALALMAAGAIPWVLPCLPEEIVLTEAVRRCDGVMLSGGDDLEPGLYRDRLPESLRKTVVPCDARRDLAEMLILREVFRQRKPLLAICRGQQILNVALGGTLFVDIAQERPHALNHQQGARKDDLVHKVALTPDSILTKITGRRILGVNSSHHQAVAEVAEPLRVTATSSDGIIEGMELAKSNWLPYLLAVQFHPERLFHKHPAHLDLFKDFTRACRPRRRKPV